MSTTSFVGLLLFISYTEGNFFTKVFDQDDGTLYCVRDIIKEYFLEYKELTYVDLNSDYEEIIKTINVDIILAVLSRTANTHLNLPDYNYLIIARNASDFLTSFEDVERESQWSSSTRFLILILNLVEDELECIFDEFLKFHIINVLVVSGSTDPNLYTYNPFENYGCGIRYSRVIDYGKCSRIQSHNLYPFKLETKLKNCTFRVKSPHWPPYSINPKKNKHKGLLGIEEQILKEISTLEQFTLNYTYSDDAEIYTIITSNMSADGPLYSLQIGETDIILGGMLLTATRAMAFNYIFEHLAFSDDIRYFVKKATAVSSWKNMYLEFNYVVWIALFLSIVVYFSIFILLVRPKDKGQILLKMMAFMVLNSSTITGNNVTKLLFVVWVWFAYLVSTYYQSILMSLTANPSLNYQISSEMDIAKYDLKPCVSEGIRRYLQSVENYTFEENDHEYCNYLLESLNTVSQSDDLFTVTMKTIYTYNKYSFYDKTGESLIYTIRQPLSKTIYAFYLYKGFPMLDRLSLHALRLKESGLIDFHLRNLYLQNIDKYRFIAIERKDRIDTGWYILLCGYSLSLGIFIMEILIKRYSPSSCYIITAY